jgi:hypothetical protein
MEFNIMARYPSYDVARFDQQFAETSSEKNERLKNSRMKKADANLVAEMLEALKDALWVLDNVAAINGTLKIESTLTDPRPAIRAVIAKAEAKANG